MAYPDVQQTEFNRATENLIEITWTYVNLQKEFPKLSETDSMGWKQMFVVWANEFEENYGRTDWDESEKTYQEAIEEFAKEKIFQWVGIRKYICIDRHIEGITLNPYEWLMEKGRKVKLFENEVEAKAFQKLDFLVASIARKLKSCGSFLEKSPLMMKMLFWKSSWDFQKGQTE